MRADTPSGLARSAKQRPEPVPSRFGHARALHLSSVCFLTLVVAGTLGTGSASSFPARPGSPHGVPAIAADTILRRDLSRQPVAVRLGLVARPGAPSLRLGLRRIPVAGLVTARPELTFMAGARGLPRPTLVVAPPPPVPPLLAAALLVRARDPLRTPLTWTEAFLPPPRSPTAGRRRAVPAGPAAPGRFRSEYADLALDVRSRMELGGEWARFRPCNDNLRESCNPNLLPRLSPDTRFGVLLQGTVLDRLDVDVDFDQAREFGGDNRINISYEGAEDDILRGLDVGDVTFDLPRSRFLTDAVPVGNFGFQADGQVGPLEFQGVWAQQRGDLNSRVFRLTGLGDRKEFVQEDTVAVDDADYVRGQFFFLVDPALITDYPHVDALSLDPSSAPPHVAPGIEPVQLYRLEDDPTLLQQVEGYIQADAVAEAGGRTVSEAGWFRLLRPGIDYFMHPSGLWLALGAPLAPEEMLAVTYVTATGDTVGSYNPELAHNRGERPTLRLLRASGANHRPGRPSWRHEMHNVYRVHGSDAVEAGSVGLTVSLGEPSAGRTFKRAPSGEDVTFLRLLGLDEEAPADQLDEARIFSLGDDVFGSDPPVRGSFIFFPTQRPFADPPPVPSLGLTAPDAARLLGDDANPRIYDEEDPFERGNAGRFRLTVSYRLRSRGVISSFSLGAIGLRPGSERISLGERVLTPSTDYEIDYDLGQVTLLEPERLFTANPDAAVRVTWEQRSLFQASPTQVLGLRTRTALGSGGELNVLSLYRSERSVMPRPVLGTEPKSALLGGIGGTYEAGLHWLDRVLEAVPGLRVSGGSGISFQGEIAASLPNPNTSDYAFLDDFDGSAHSTVSLFARDWLRGSAPTSGSGAESIAPTGFSGVNLSPVVWQQAWIESSASGDSLGLHEGYFPHLDIDRRIRVAGSEQREAGLLLSFGGRGPDPAWASLTTVLATNGLDLSRTEFLEFYAAGGEEMALVIDLGTVSEDALWLDRHGAAAGVRSSDGRAWGKGVLDQEADPRKGEIWGEEADQRGVWDEACVAERGRVYRIGDPRATCTRGNGRVDGEDLDRDGVLDTDERHLRFVLPLDGTSPHLARTSLETETEFQLYRIPISGAEALEVGGGFGAADLRSVRHLRFTLVGVGERSVRLARMRLVGSRWVKRAGAGVILGMVGDREGFGRVEVGTVSRLTEGDGYSPPPGVLEALSDPNLAFAGEGIEFNERSLAITFDGMEAGARTEVYHRFPQRPRNFLAYREARLWVAARSGEFGPDLPHMFFVKVGNDPDNFYLFRTTLPPTERLGRDGIVPQDWVPEIRIDFDQWLDLRLEAEEALILDPPALGAPPLELWSADSSYAVVLNDRGRAPNLAAVREMSMGIWNGGPAPLSGEVWVNELRLGRAVRDLGVAGSMDFELSGAGALSGRLSVTDRGAYFRQLGDEPSYQDDRTVNLHSTLALDRFMPLEWGMVAPLTLEHGRVRYAPRLLPESDLRAEHLARLRPTFSRQTRVGISLRKETETANPWLSAVVDGLGARFSYLSSSGSSITTRHESDNVDAGIEWAIEPRNRTLSLVPAFAEGVLRSLLPGSLEERVLDSRLRWTPVRVSVGTGYARRDARVSRYARIVELPGDSVAPITQVARELVETAADISFQPLGPLTADVSFLSTRDVLPPDEAATDDRIRVLLAAERNRTLGVDIGWETHRSLLTSVAFEPELARWLRADLRLSTRYLSDRNAQFVEERARTVGTVGMVGVAPPGREVEPPLTLTRDANGRRDWRTTLFFEPGGLADALFGGGEEANRGAPDGLERVVGAVLRAVHPLSVGYEDRVASRFDRDPVNPGTAYQLGWGGVDAFRVIGADTAATLTETTGWTIRGGVGLPGRLSVTAGYREADALALDTRSDRRLRERDWPDLRASLPGLPMPRWTGVRTVALSWGVTRTEIESEFGEGIQRRSQRATHLPASVSVSWLGNLTTSYETRMRTGSGSDPTGETRPEARNHRLTVSSTFMPPGELAARLDRPVRVSVLGLHSSESNCRTTATQDGCVPFVDQLARSLSLSLDTTVQGFELGLQLSYDDRRSFVGQQAGSTHLRLLVFGEMRISAGSIIRG